MQLTCNQKDLTGALSLVGRAAPARSTLFVLSNVLLETEPERLRLSATDLEVSITHRIDADVKKHGGITVPIKTLRDLAKLLPGEQVALSTDGLALKIKCGKHRASIKGLGAQEFPEIPSPPEEAIALPTALFQEMIRQGGLAAATEEGRPVLSGVLMTLKDGVLALSAADGFRLSQRAEAVELDGYFGVIVPRRSLQEVLRMAGDEIAVGFLKNAVTFATGDTQIISQLILGSFPDFESIIPQESEVSAVVNRGDLQRACKMTSVFAENNLTKYSFGENSLTLSSVSAELGDSTAILDARVVGELDIALDCRYVSDILEVIPGAEVVFEMNSEASPCLIRPADESTFINVVMPMREIGRDAN